ncbi:MAG TPA: PKD domain-containing protein [Solirubrobacterales bacterium]|nr:PKD domain-containing protein [Solirubrobacterales bacterium]
MSLVSERRGRSIFVALASASLSLALVALLVIAGQARAAENVYWDNYNTDSVSFADITGSGGGALNLTGVTLNDPEGMAFDSATGRLYVASSTGAPGTTGEIVYVNIDGSGAGVFNTSGALVDEPYGVAIDPTTRTIYWANSGSSSSKGSIGYAKLDGGGGGLLNTSGVTVAEPYKLAADPVSGKVFWGNTEGTDAIAYANLNNSGGGGLLNTTGATPPSSIYAIAVADGRVYWLESTSKRVSFAGVGGGSGGDIDLSAAPFNSAYGLAIDPTVGRMYWGNYGSGTTTTNAIGFAGLNGTSPGGITPASAPVDGPQDPVIVKSPTGTGAPAVTRSTKSRSELACSTGSWAADLAGSFVYQAPRTFAYQWTLNGAAIAGATTPTLAAAKPGSYACSVTATNQLGSANQTSAPINVKAAKVKLTTKKKAKVKPGGVATFKVKGVNQGDLKSKNARVCVKLPGKAKGELTAKPKCKALGKVKGKGKDSAKLRVKVGENAGGTYKVTFQVKGSPGKAAKAKIVVG